MKRAFVRRLLKRKTLRPNFAALFLMMLGVACSPAPEPQEPQKCVGGVIRPDGTCEAKCVPDRCVANNTCVDNKCVLKCEAHSDCLPYSQECLPEVEDDTGAQIFTCQDVPVREFGDPCPNGNECDVCFRSGPGDAKSYCTLLCEADADCPGGYECGMVRDPHEICGTNKGNSGFCGTTSEPCIPSEELANYGLVEGDLCAYKKMCLKKDVCATCETDVDCSRTGTSCVPTESGELRCAVGCGQDSDCEADKTCWEGHCLPRFGTCESAEPRFCAPCRYDADCGGGTWGCIPLHGAEKACIDLSFPVACDTDADCPLSPGGRRGDCISVGSRKGCYAPSNGNFTTCY
jgi:hypothetical protein